MYALHFFTPATRRSSRSGPLNERGMMDDKLMRRIVIDALDGERTINSACIGVAVENGVVTLTGHVGSQTQRLAAEEAARRVRGIRRIVSQVEVRASGRTRFDEEIARRARIGIAWHAHVDDSVIKAQVENGWVTLTGAVADAYERREAEEAVRKLDDVAGITNLIEVRMSGTLDQGEDLLDGHLVQGAAGDVAF